MHLLNCLVPGPKVKDYLLNHVEGRSKAQLMLHLTINFVPQGTTPDRRNPCIVTVWIQQANSAPKLVTAYPGS